MPIADQAYDEKLVIAELLLDISDLKLAGTSVTNLPAGLHYDEATRSISGIATEIGSKIVTVKARDESTNQTSLTFRIVVKDVTAPEITIIEPDTQPAREKNYSWTASDNHSPEAKLQLGYAVI
ncbi:MAG: Ig domain-containing protein [bacterium]|nr:Ig domain-containing protein [bacterium]